MGRHVLRVWGAALRSPYHQFFILCGPVVEDERHPAFCGVAGQTNTVVELSEYVDFFGGWNCVPTPANSRVRLLYNNQFAAGVD